MNRSSSPRRRAARNAVLVLLAVCFLAGCLWRFTSWHQRFGFSTLVQWGRVIQGHPWTPVGVIVVFVLAGLIFFVHAVLLWVTVFTFDAFHAFIYCELGSLASALVVYGLGRVLREDVVERIAGSYMEEVSRALARRGVLTLILLHVFPICPFSVLNLLAGATHIGFKDYVIGTVLGITPGLVVLSLFGERLMEIIQTPDLPDAAALTAFVGAGVFIFWKLRQRLLSKVIQTK